MKNLQKNMKNKLILILTLAFMTVAATFAAQPPAWCWVNKIKKNDPRCPMTSYSIKELDGHMYSVYCYRISPTLGFLEAEPEAPGYKKIMYCAESLEWYNVTCIYICEWTSLTGLANNFTNVDYKIFGTHKINEPLDTPCQECVTD